MKKISILLLVITLGCFHAFAQADSLTIHDTRGAATLPKDYSRVLKAHFKYSSVMGLSWGGTPFHTIVGLRGWSDNTGGKAHELAFSDDSKLLLRSGFEPAWEGWRQILVSSDNGNFGIGIDSPTEKLAVNGNIRAKEIKVETANWPDYVFAKDYSLPSLAETEKHIKEKGHLQGIPSAKEVEANGIDLGEMNAKLLQKIEELTLHLIEKEKTEKNHEQEIRLLKQQVAKIINQINQ